MSLKKAWKEGNGNYGPIQVNLEPTIRCNLNCRMCHRDKKSKYRDYLKNEIETSHLLSLVGDLSQMGTKQVLIAGGGEPLLRKDIFLIISELKKKKIYIHLWTNGTQINSDNYKFLANNVDMLTISLDSAFPQIHDYIRGVNGTFKKIETGLRLLGKTSKTPYLRIHTVISNLNFKSLLPFIGFCKKFKIREVSAAILNQNNIVEKDLLIPEDIFQDLNRYIMDFVEKAKKNNLRLAGIYNNSFYNEIQKLKREFSFSETLHENNCTTCFGLWEWASIRPNGDVSICCFIDKPILGNLKRNNFKEIWTSKIANQFRNQVKRGEFLDKICKGCMQGHPLLTYLIKNNSNAEKIINSLITNSL